ncbi:MAG TPA: hypothetical protein PKV38_01355 [bacterium]|nr:hypothetical protein [bacterium]
MQTQTYLIVALVVVVALVMGIIVFMPTDQAYKSTQPPSLLEPAAATPAALPAATPASVKEAARGVRQPGVRSESPGQVPFPGDLAPAGEPVTAPVQPKEIEPSDTNELMIEGQDSPRSPAQPR